LAFQATISNCQLHVSYAQFSNGLTQNLNSASHIQSENCTLHFCSADFSMKIKSRTWKLT